MEQREYREALLKDEHHHRINELITLAGTKVKNMLSTTHREIADDYLAELFRGNGWAVNIYGDKKKALLLSDPSNPDTVLLIVRFLLNEKELTYNEAREELVLFENLLSPVHGCCQFCLVALNGYEQKAEKLENFNMLLQDWSYAEELVTHYSKEKIKEPRIQLFAHNKQTYKKVKKMMQQHKSVAVVQATGTGKSYLIAKMLQDFSGQKRLVMAPSMYIINQLKDHIPYDGDKITFLTYMRLSYMSDEDIRNLDADMIVLDEYHRGGAEEWGRAVQHLLAAFPDAFKFGTTATPVRYMDNARDMSDELFEGNVAENLNLSQAVIRRILPMPKYVCALYTLDEEVKNLREKISQSNKAPDAKDKLLLELDAFKINWEQSRGIPYVLKKHLGAKMNKFIVFCRDQEHLMEMEPQVKKWFQQSQDKKIVTYRVFLKEDEKDENLERFKQADDKNAMHLLFSINMLNEGLHVNEVSGVMLLRPTESPNIFYQQIGRCMKVGMNQRPVIFDMVNNFKSIRTGDFMRDLEFSRLDYLKERNEEGLEQDITPRFTVIDEVREITEVFGEIRFRVDNWLDMFDQLVAFKKEHKHFFVPLVNESNIKLNNWINQQRYRFKSGQLAEDRIEKLQSIGFYWEGLDERWNAGFSKLVQYKEKHGHCNVPLFDENERVLGYWLYKQRKMYVDKQLLPERIEKLEKLGVDWKTETLNRDLQDLWNKFYAELCLYKQTFGTANVAITSKTHGRLGQWLTYQRNRRKTGALTDEKIKKLDELGIDWDPKLTKFSKWDTAFEKLCAFKEQHGHADVKLNYTDRDLAFWVRHQRYKYKNGKLPDERIKRLMAIGFNWTVLDPESWNKQFDKLKTFYEANGHFKVNDSELSKWMSRQRQEYKTGILKEKYIEKLESVNFELNPVSSDEQWEAMYNQLVAYRQKYGHCNVVHKEKEYASLGPWVTAQRGKRRRKKLSEDRVRKLEQLGLSWEPEEEEWNQRFNELKEYKAKCGDTLVPSEWSENKVLANWVATQRYTRRKNQLKPEKLSLLDAIGFSWDPMTENWEKMFEELTRFKKEHGHCYVSLGNKQYKQLAHWTGVQCRNWRSGILLPHYRERLENLGLKINKDEMYWDIKFSELEKYKQQFGDCYVPYDSKTHRLLAYWLLKQRLLYKKGKLEEARMKKLQELGYLFDRVNWAAMFDELKKFKAKFGHCNVPGTSKEYLLLGRWTATQRADYRDKTITPQRIELLNDIGFEWERKSGREKAWMDGYEMLKDFFNKEGHTTLPAESAGTELHSWCRRQRAAFKDGRIDEKKKQLLEALNFAWVLKEDPEILFNERYQMLLDIKKEKGFADVSGNRMLQKWIGNLKEYKRIGTLSADKIQKLEDLGIDLSRGLSAKAQRENNFKLLVEFKNKYGHCNVGSEHQGYEKLKTWVHNMRQWYRMGKMGNDFYKRLDDLGFSWVYKEKEVEDHWMKMYNRLEEYKKENGNCNVIDKRNDSNELSRWVGSQRRNFKNNKLAEHRIELLKKIDFDFDFLNNEWERRFNELVEFKKIHGHCIVPQNKEPWKRVAEWCSTQRGRLKEGKLSDERLKKLNDIGFVWSVDDKHWEKMKNELETFLQKFTWRDLYGKNPSLFGWVNTQRESYRAGKLSKEKTGWFNQLKIEWNPMDDRWNELYNQLVDYKNKYGDCLVTIKKSKSLAGWVYNQREAFKNNMLSEEKINLLEKIGMEWDGMKRRMEKWDIYFEELKSFYRKNGHSNAPRSFNDSLYDWALNQRENKRNNRLKPEREQLLNTISFSWDPDKEMKEKTWMQKYNELKIFKQKNGNCRVTKTSGNAPLAAWVAAQRQRLKKNLMTASQKELLDAIGF